MSLGPFDLYGAEFLSLYAVLLAGTTGLSLILPALLRPAGRAQSVTNVDQLAFLTGGPARLAESALTRLMTSRAVEHVQGDIFRIERTVASPSPVEARITALPTPASWSDIEAAVKPCAPRIRDKLIHADLMISDAELPAKRFWQTLPFLLLIAFGTIKLFVGLSRDRPVGFLLLLLGITGIFAAIRYFVIDQRTEAAIDAVRNAKTNATRLATAPTNPEMGVAVALFGTTVLAGSYFESLHRLRHPKNGDGGTGGADGGGDGGGGGGCGGCGS